MVSTDTFALLPNRSFLRPHNSPAWEHKEIWQALISRSSYGASNRVDHPFAEESRSLLKQLSRGRGYLVYSRRSLQSTKSGQTSMLPGILTPLLERIGVSQGGDFYLCGPSSFLQNMRDGLRNGGVLARNVHTEIFGSLDAIPLGITQVDHILICHKGRPDLVPKSHSCVAVLKSLGIRNSRACLNWRKACDVPVRWSC